MGDFPYGGGSSGGTGGTRRKIQTDRSFIRKPPKKECCPMVAAVRSVKEGKFRLARRYAAMSVRLMAARIV